MSTKNKNSHPLITWGRSILTCGALSLVLASTLATAQEQHSHDSASPAKLVQLVRTATSQFADVNAATGAGYTPLFGCVSGPDHGAMGIHYINLQFVGDGEIDGQHPEAIIYEPTRNGMRMVGVEYIVDSATWLANHPAPPQLEGQAFQLVGSPNRYGLPPSSNSMSGLGARTLTAPSSTGTTTSPARNSNRIWARAESRPTLSVPHFCPPLAEVGKNNLYKSS